MLIKSFKYRIYPTVEQEVLIEKHFGSCRWLYNFCLKKNIESYQINKAHISRFELQKEIPILKQNQETSWLKEVNSLSLIATLENLEKAYTMFFRDKKSFPNFKKKHSSKKTFSIPQNTIVFFDQNKVSIPKFKEGIKCKFTRKFEGNIKTSAISKTSTNKYYISIKIETNNNIPEKKPICESQTVGIDLGIKTFVTISDGVSIDNPRFLKTSLKKLKRLQRSHSRKKKGSQNKQKSKNKLSLQHEKVSNQRKDFLHKTTKQLVRNYNTICLESLSARNMMKNHKLSQALSDISIGEFNRQMEYKSEWYGCNLLKIGRFEPSSKTCNNCGNIKLHLNLSERIFNCENCGHSENRDLNAAKNIKNIGLMTLLQGMQDVKSAEMLQ